MDSVSNPIYKFGGIFDLIMDSDDMEASENQGEQEFSQLIGENRSSDENYPAGSWKAPLGPGEAYPGSNRWPLSNTKKCNADDMKELNFWALKQAKTRLPVEG